MEYKETRLESWMKVILPVLTPMLITGCIYLAGVVMNQGEQIRDLTRANQDQGEMLKQYTSRMNNINSDIQNIRVDLSKLETKLQSTSEAQNKTVDILKDLNTTLERINVTVGKLETRLDYAERQKGV